MLCLLLSLIISRIEANTNNYSISGRISDERTGSPLPGASILIKGTYLWAVSDQKGEFTIQGIQEGKYQLEVSFLGYVPATVPVNVNNSIKGLKIQLKENTLALNDVIVTAQAPKSELNTTLNIGSNALEHLQISNVSDISALLPGGKTKVPDLTSNNIFSLRDGGSSAGNAAFGTAIEVDGVRIGNNSSFGNMTGIDTRSISVADIESVEVITEVPSAEYGDLNSGMVKIHTKKGKTPWNVLLSINPRTEQVSFSKGLDLGNDKGIVNISGEWTKATQKLNSPYTSYTRRGFSASYSNTFRKVLRFDIGLTGNIGGMNTKDDPDAYTGEYTKVRDNVFRANTSLAWLLNKSWITNLKLDASVYYNDNKSHAHTPYSYASEQPAVHAEQEGYFIAGKLPYHFFADQIVDSKELDYAASLKYEWNRYQQSESRRAMERNRQCGRRRVLSESFAGSQRISPPFLLGLSVYAQCFVVCGRKPVGTCRQHHAEADGGIALGESVHQRNAIRQAEHTVATFQRQMAAERKHSDSGRMGSDREAAFVLCTLSPTGVSGYSDFRSLIQ